MCVSMTAFSRRGFDFSRDIVRLNGKQPCYPSRSETLSINGTLLRRYPMSSCITSRILSASSESCKMFSSARTPITFENVSEVLTKQRAKEFTSKLTPEERKLFLAALNECKSEEDKADYEELSTKDLVLVAIANAIPFVGFGFLDNFIMIIAGDQIEMLFNAKFPISTMAAAALGNTVSDVIGIGSVHYVEMFAQKVGFEAPKLTLAQLNLPRTRVAANVGRVIGVTIGCLLGMTPIPVAALFRNGS